MAARRTTSLRSSVGGPRNAELGPRPTLEEEAVECPNSFIEAHFFYSLTLPDGREETTVNEHKVVALHNLFEKERQCLDEAAERRGLRTTSIGSRRRNWTLVIGCNIEAVSRRVVELFRKEAERDGSLAFSEKVKEVAGAGQARNECKRKQEAGKVVVERSAFVEEQRRQCERRKFDVQNEHQAYLSVAGMNNDLSGQGEWRAQSEALAKDYPEFSGRFDLRLAFPEAKNPRGDAKTSFGWFDFGLVRGVVRLEKPYFGKGNSIFDWRGMDTEGKFHEGRGHLTVMPGKFPHTRMKGVIIATSLASSSSLLNAYEFEAYKVNGAPRCVTATSWLENRGMTTRFEDEFENEYLSGESKNDSNCPPSGAALQNDAQDLKRVIDEKKSTVRDMESRLLDIYYEHGKRVHARWRAQHQSGLRGKPSWSKNLLGEEEDDDDNRVSSWLQNEFIDEEDREVEDAEKAEEDEDLPPETGVNVNHSLSEEQKNVPLAKKGRYV